MAEIGAAAGYEKEDIVSFDRRQFRDLIGRRLEEHGLHSQAAANLLLGTAAHESHFGTFLYQKHGPAVGVFQMEPETFYWLREKYAERFPQIRNRRAEELEWDLDLAILMARLRYRVVPFALPEADDLPGLARYYKRHYNSPLGAATEEDFIAAYRRYVLGEA